MPWRRRYALDLFVHRGASAGDKAAQRGWFLLRNLSQDTLGLLLAAGAGAMFYLTVTELVPEAESHQFQQSSAIAAAAGLLVIFTLSHLSSA